MREREEIMKTKGISWGKGGAEEVSFEWEKGENDVSSAVSSYEISRISEHEMEIVNEDFGQRHEAFKESSRANNF